MIEETTRVEMDYPRPGATLFANVRSAAGWLGRDGLAASRIALRIDSKAAGVGRMGYPRVDAARGGLAWDNAMRAGFRCEFDPSGLSPGAHELEFTATFPDGEHQWSVPVVAGGQDAPVHVSEVFVDVAGICNLRCAMCPQGSIEGLKQNRSLGLMAPVLFEKVLRRLETSGMLPAYVNLYNWGDPMVHGEIDRLLEITRTVQRKAIVSSNLSVSSRQVDKLIHGGADLLIVSISGMTQDVYERNHRGGRLARVLDNARAVAQAPNAVRQVLLKFLAFQYNE